MILWYTRITVVVLWEYTRFTMPDNVHTDTLVHAMLIYSTHWLRRGNRMEQYAVRQTTWQGLVPFNLWTHEAKHMLAKLYDLPWMPYGFQYFSDTDFGYVQNGRVVVFFVCARAAADGRRLLSFLMRHLLSKFGLNYCKKSQADEKIRENEKKKIRNSSYACNLVRWPFLLWSTISTPIPLRLFEKP